MDVSSSLNEITMIYEVKTDEKEIRLFGDDFVKQNKSKCTLNINGKNKKLFSVIKIQNEKTIKVILKENKTITDMKYMFKECSSLVSISGFSKWNITNVTNIHGIFYNCSSLKDLSDISKWDTSNITDMGMAFRGCSSLLKLPDLSNWNISKVNNISFIFCDC